MKKKINFAIFCGGSGSVELINLINKCDFIEPSLIINGYDDGKSTKVIRSLVGDFLGPSDFRKNVSHLMNNKILKDIIDFRFKKISKNDLNNFLKLNDKTKYVKYLKIDQLSSQKFNKLKIYFNVLSKFIRKKKYNKFYDLSLGNIIFSGIFLNTNRNFNYALDLYQSFFDINQRVFNVTDGENLYLSALLENNIFLKGEDVIVESNYKSPITDIFLTKENFRNYKFNKIEFIKKKLKNKSISPNLNEKVKSILNHADVILYCPGTQHSSLFPSFLTKNIGKIIKKSRAKKFLVTNIFFDKDMKSETADTLINKFMFYMKNKNLYKNITFRDIIDYYFINADDEDDVNKTNKNYYLQYYGQIKKNTIFTNWEKNKGVHFPNIVLKNILNKINCKNETPFLTISIIVPVLNEEKKIFKVIEKLKKFKETQKDFFYEIIVVDGGSTDKTKKIIEKFRDVRFYCLDNAKRGDAYRYGIKKSRGDIVVFFPSDMEYSETDIVKLITPIFNRQTDVVYGSREIKTYDNEKNLNIIYKNNFTSRIASFYGGKFIKIFLLIFHNLSITDPLCTVKAFEANSVKNLVLRNHSVDLDMELYIKLKKAKKFFIEIPVNYIPRTKKDGKKITLLNGLGCLYYILKSFF